jgi:hypothetical protein
MKMGKRAAESEVPSLSTEEMDRLLAWLVPTKEHIPGEQLEYKFKVTEHFMRHYGGRNLPVFYSTSESIVNLLRNCWISEQYKSSPSYRRVESIAPSNDELEKDVKKAAGNSYKVLKQVLHHVENQLKSDPEYARKFFLAVYASSEFRQQDADEMKVAFLSRFGINRSEQHEISKFFKGVSTNTGTRTGSFTH